MFIDTSIRQAYHEQIQLELFDVAWFILALYCLTFIVSYLLMGWAVSPFKNAESVLRSTLNDKKKKLIETDWLSESPSFHKVIWGLAKRLTDSKYPFDEIEEPKYSFNFRFFLKFVFCFYAISIVTGYILGIVFNTVYLKIVNLAIVLVTMRQKGHFFLAQEELLRAAVNITMILSCLIYAIIGYYITRYMSNMLFVFTRAVKEHHFPLKLRDSDVYHSLAKAISDVASAAGLSKK